MKKGNLTPLSSLTVPFGLGQFDGFEERGGKSFAITFTTTQVAGLEVTVQTVGSTRARIVRIIREEGRNELVDGFRTLVPWSHL